DESAPEGISFLCLTVKGSRITASGPVAYEQVTTPGPSCSWRSPIAARADALLRADAPGQAVWPKIALARAAAAGGIEMVGHTTPWAVAGAVGRGSTNLIVHFPGGQSLEHLSNLVQALKQSGRDNTAAAIVVVLSASQLSRVKFERGIAFADDGEAWTR